MARLCRFHLAGLGLAAARFNPLTIDLRDPSSGNAQDSVLWLRNGGGKTTLIALLYSTLVPDKRHFLGKLLGKDSGLADFVRNNDLGVVVTEWEFPGQFGVPRRVVGQAVKCVDGETTRKFFSFASTESYGFDQVPVLGLKASHPARTLEELLERVRREADEAGGRLDLVIPIDQKEWSDHLEKIGLDPELFEAHLKMNKQEGGAAELFKLKSADDFLRLFLDLIVDEESTAEEEKSLEALRAKVIQTPDREAAVNFGKEVLVGLEAFANEAKSLAAKRQEEAQLQIDKGRAARSIQDRIALWKDQQVKETENQEAAVTEKADYRKKRENLWRYANGYRRRAQILRIEEAKVALQAATGLRKRAQHDAQVAEAAVPWAKAARELTEKRAYETALSAAREEHRTEFEEVLKLGGVAAAAWESRRAAAKERLEQLQNAGKAAKEERERLENERAEITGKIRTAEAEQGEAQRKLDDRRNARERLRNKGTLESDETPEDGKRRWSSELDQAQIKRNKSISDKAEAQQELTSARTALQATRTNLAAKGNILERVRTDKRHIEEEHSNIGQLQCVLDLCAGKPGDPRSEPLLHNLEHQSEATQRKLVRHQIEVLEDTRTEKSLIQNGLAAPSQDLELTLEWLDREGVKSALPAYQWLAEHCKEEEARLLLSRDPATWSGILVQVQTEWVSLKDKPLRLPIKSPMVLSMVGAEEQQRVMMPVQTVLPEDGAMFSKARAEELRAGLQERRVMQDRKEEELREALSALNNAISRVKEFNRKWPLTTWNHLLQEEQATEEAKRSLEGEEKEFESKEQGLLTQIEELTQIEAKLAENAASARQHLSHLETFLVEHEANAPHWLDLFTDSQRVAEEGRANSKTESSA